MRHGFALVALALLNAPAYADVVTFDDLPPSDIGAIVPDGYGGLRWTNLLYIDSDLGGEAYAGSGYENGRVSGRHVAFNSDAQPAIVSAVEPFRFISAYLTAAWNTDLTVEVTGFMGGQQRYRRSVQVDYVAPTFVEFDFRGVDRLRFASFGGLPSDLKGSGEHFVLDNLSFQQGAPIAEPSTLLLLSAGAIAGLARRRNRGRV